ncbi:hypothetical protein LLG95_06195 [bacterium]|nr:hypothetical protein [bacterium]
MAEPDIDLKPLRHPIRPRDIFFTRNASPILELVRTKPRRKYEILVAAMTALIPIWWLYRMYWLRGPRDDQIEETFAFNLVMGWITLEGACLLYGLKLGWLASPATRRRRLCDMVMSELRPIEICQLIGAKRIWTPAVFIALFMAGLMFAHLLFFPACGYFLFGYALVGMNAILTLYMTHWVQAALYVSTDSRITALRRQVMLVFIYALFVFWLMVIYIGLCASWSEASGNRGGPSTMTLVMMTLPMTVPFWWLKYRIARAYAERIEQAIFPQIEM